jgi:hypothetical protein
MSAKLLFLVVCGCCLVVSAPQLPAAQAVAQEGVHEERFEGTIDAIEQSYLVVAFGMQELTFTVPVEAVIRLDGQFVTLAELQPGYFVVIIADVNGENRIAKSIDASRVW